MRKNDDKEAVTSLLVNHLKMRPIDYDIVECVRLFKPTAPNQSNEEDGIAQKPRLLKVRFMYEETVSIVMRSASNLENATDTNVKKVRIFRDKSKKEREVRRNLLAQADSKNETEEDSANFKWVINYQNHKVMRVPRGEPRRRSFRERTNI